jgi:type IV secretion system protein VirB9
VKLAPGSQASVHFPADEVPTIHELGDPQAWRVVAFDAPQMIVRSLRPAAPTFLRVNTNRRRYEFALASVSDRALNSAGTIRFAQSAVATAAAPAVTPSSSPTRYRVSGNRSLYPVSIWDDGRQMVIVWRPEQELPAVFAMDGRQEVLVNGHMRGGRFVIDLVYPLLVFRLGSEEARAEPHRERRR